MPRPGSHTYDLQKQKLRHDLEAQGVDDDTAEEVADEAMRREVATGADHPQPRLPPQASPSANPPGIKRRKRPDVPEPMEEQDMTSINVTELGDDRFGVEVDEGRIHTGHTVTVPSEFLDDVGWLDVEPERVARETIAFLLDRDVSTAIGDEIAVPDVAARYPDYVDELPVRLSGG